MLGWIIDVAKFLEILIYLTEIKNSLKEKFKYTDRDVIGWLSINKRLARTLGVTQPWIAIVVHTRCQSLPVFQSDDMIS